MNLPALRFKEFSGEWKLHSLGAITETITSGSRDWAKYYSKSGSKFIRMTNLSREGIQLKLDDLRFVDIKSTSTDGERTSLIQGDILLSITAELGKIGWIPSNFGKAFINQHTALIRLKSAFANSTFTAHLLSTSKLNKQINGLNDAGAKAGLNLSTIKSMHITLPVLKEQTKIANFLTAVDEKITQLTQKHEHLTQYKKGVMQQIFSQELRFKDDDGLDFPDWEEATLGEVAKFRRGSFPQPYGLAKWYDDVNGMPFIQVFDVSDNFKLKNTTKRSISKEAQQQSVFVKAGSILITIQGSIGRIAVTQYDAYVDRTLLLFESFKVKINKHYFAYTLFLLFEIEKEKAPGGIIKTITKEVLTDFKVFICDYEEQTKIANFLTAIDNKITATQTQLQAVKQYKQGLLQQMFV